MQSEIRARKVFERLLFSTSWEDPLMDLEAFRIRKDEDVVFAVTSGGDKILCFLTECPRKIIALDMNATQNYLLELKMAGIRALSHGDYLELLGVRPPSRALELYRAARPYLSPGAAAYWDENASMLPRGILLQGRFERYLGLFRHALRFIEGQRRVRRLFTFEQLQDQAEFYRREWNSIRWRLFFKIFFSKTLLAALGLDPAFFRYAREKSVSENLYRKGEHAFSEIPVRTNYFMAQILLGRYLDEQQVPLYLQARHFDTLRQNLDRIEIHHGDAEGFFAGRPPQSIDKFDFTNIFEWMAEDTFEKLLRSAVRCAKPGAVMTYRNTLVPRSHPSSMDDTVVSDRELARNLLFQDRSFFYSDFIVERVGK
jgi:S-adenosylmethionine-diacylglycerol 3-amino-3-carboxypropyl transferase